MMPCSNIVSNLKLLFHQRRGKNYRLIRKYIISKIYNLVKQLLLSNSILYGSYMKVQDSTLLQMGITTLKETNGVFLQIFLLRKEEKKKVK